LSSDSLVEVLSIEFCRLLLRRLNGGSIIMLSYGKRLFRQGHPRWFQSWCPH
jgi:hypothetical protein